MSNEPTASDAGSTAIGDVAPTEVLDELNAAFEQGGMPTSQPGEVSPSIIAESLVPEATRRSQRRSRREAKREAKLEAKRAAALAKAAERVAKEERAAAKKAAKGKPRRQPDVDVETVSDDGDLGVRIIQGPPRPEATSGVAALSVPDAEQRATVFIDDSGRGTGEIVTIDVATSAARMEPRMRERRIAVKRAVGRKRLKWLAVAGAVAAIVVAVLGALGSGLFAISTVEVEGAVYSQGDALDAVVDDLEGANVLRVDTAAAERTLEAIPWIDDARVTTDFPHGAKIEVRERQPAVAYLAADGSYRVLDSEGRVLDVIAGRPVDYLELMVEDGPELEAGQSAPRGYRAAATLVSALTPQMRQRASSVSIDQNATELSMTLDDQIEVRFGAPEDLLDKLVRLQTALTNSDPALAATELIDVSTEDVIVR